MTVEELEIIITTNIQKAMPNIRKVVKEVKNAVNETKGLNADVFKGIDMGKVASDVSKATNTAIKETKKMKEQLKNLGLKDAGDTTGLKIQGIAREIAGISNKFKELKGQRGVLGDVLEAQKFKQQAEEMKRAVNSIGGASYKKYNTQSIQNTIDNFKGGNVKRTVVQADTKKAENDVDKLNAKLNNINGKKVKADVKTNASSELNKSNTFANRLKNAMQQVKKQMDGSGASSKKISSGLNSAMGSVSKIAGSLQVGLGQILKIAGALFSLRSIYSILSNSANAWLSSQNAQAQQLSANIDYMKYALGSVLAPVIQWIVNLIYQALKGVQSLIYALTGVNIFANASAKAYSSMAGSAKKAKDETKQLAGIHNEINNIQDNKGSDSSGGGGGGASPSFDLSNIDNKFNSLTQKFKEGKWYEAGAEIGNKINQTLEKIPWNSIKEKASSIGKGIAEFLNGGIASTNWNLVGETLAEGINTVIEFAYAFVTTFDFEKFGQAIGNTINGFIKKLDFKKLGKTIGKILSGILKVVSQLIKTLDWSSIVEAWFTFILSVITNIDWGTIVSTIFYLIGLGWGLQLKAFLTVITTTCETIKEHFEKKLEEAGGNAAKGLWNGIIDGLGNIGKWVLDNIVMPIVNGFKNAMGIHSPSTVMAELGKNVIEGLIKGIKDKIGNLSSTILNVCGNIKTWFRNNLTSSNFVQNGRGIIEGIKSGMQNNSVYSIISNICNNIKIWFNNNIASSNFVQNGKNVIDGIKSGLQSNSAFSTVNNICLNIKNWFQNNLSGWNFFNIGKNIMNGIKNGMLNTNLASTAANIAASIATSFRSSLGIHSPSKVMADYVGKFIPLGIAEGIRSQAKSVYASVNEITNGLKLDNQGLISDMSATYSRVSINSNLSSGSEIMERALSSSILNSSNNNQPIQITLNVGNARLAKILLDDLRDMKRASGKDIEALVGG